MKKEKIIIKQDIAELIIWQGWAPLASFLPAVILRLMVND